MYTSYYTLSTAHFTPYIYTACCTLIKSWLCSNSSWWRQNYRWYINHSLICPAAKFPQRLKKNPVLWSPWLSLFAGLYRLLCSVLQKRPGFRTCYSWKWANIVTLNSQPKLQYFIIRFKMAGDGGRYNLLIIGVG